MENRNRLLGGLFFLSFGVILCALIVGNDFIGYQEFIASLVDKGDSLTHSILVDIRLPRVWSAFVTGGLLALAGTLMQVLLRNPLADPYVLGVSGGTAVVSLILMGMGIGGYWLIGGAWLGGLISVVLLISMAKSLRGDHLLLTGVGLASGFSALISLILIISPEHMLRGMLFWLVGDLSYATFPLYESGILLFGLITAIVMARELNMLARGDAEARSLGVNTDSLRLKLILLSSLLTAAAVTVAGCIGFIGLIVPHCYRLLGNYDHRYLLPGSLLLGGCLLTLADTLARTVIFPQELPVGIMMALLGIPTFLLLLRKKSS